jgi:hypothetical protein
MSGPAEALPTIPDLPEEQRIFVSTTLLEDLGFGKYLNTEIVYEEESVIAGKFLTHPKCYEKAIFPILTYKKLERERTKSYEDYEKYDTHRQNLRRRIGGMLKIEVVEEQAG